MFHFLLISPALKLPGLLLGMSRGDDVKFGVKTPAGAREQLAALAIRRRVDYTLPRHLSICWGSDRGSCPVSGRANCWLSKQRLQFNRPCETVCISCGQIYGYTSAVPGAALTTFGCMRLGGGLCTVSPKKGKEKVGNSTLSKPQAWMKWWAVRATWRSGQWPADNLYFSPSPVTVSLVVRYLTKFK